MNLNSLQVSPSPVANSQLDDVELLRRSRRLGFMTLAARRRFLATLPEIEQRKLVPREYASIFEYAARTGGASRRQVQEILAAHRRLRTLPQIWMLLEDGVIGLSKLHRVPRALLHENPARWAEALESCSREALVRLVREAQGHPSGEGPTISVADRSGKPEGALEVLDLFSTSTSEDWGGANEPPSYPARDVQGLLRLLGRRGRKRLEVLQRERSDLAKRQITFAELIRCLVREAFFDDRPAGQGLPTPDDRKALRTRAIQLARITRVDSALPLAVKRFVRVRSQGLCEVAGCSAVGREMHHRLKRGMPRADRPDDIRNLPRHDPRAVHLLCVACHSLLHDGRFEFANRRPSAWRLISVGGPDRSDAVDRKVQEHRRRAVDEGQTQAPSISGPSPIRPEEGSLPGQRSEDSRTPPEELPGQRSDQGQAA